MFLKVTTLLPTFWFVVAASRGGKRCFNICTTLLPRGVLKFSKIRWGYDSLTVPLLVLGISCRRKTLCRENEAVGPCGKWDTVRAVGTPRCSWRRIKSVRADALALDTRFGRTSVPRLRRMAVGSKSRTSLAKAESRVEGDLDVVTRGRGSEMPDKWAYSSSTSLCASALSSNL